MAKQMSYTDSCHNSYSASYWRITDMVIELKNRRCSIVFSGYKDKQARDEGADSVGEKSYLIEGDVFDAYYAQVIAKVLNPAEVGYMFAMSTQDVFIRNELQDIDGVSTWVTIKKSFFEEAENA
jgi:hypothetical protein